MRCSLCDETAVMAEPARCKAHFIEDFERRVVETITEFDLLRTGMRVPVAVSGGKDSLTILTILKRAGHDVTAIAIDEGIAGYRDKTLEDARRHCEVLGVPLKIYSFQELAGMPLDAMVARGHHPCSVCGTLRRHLLNVAAKGFDVIATGHNADDEAQAVLMNIIKGNTELFSRLGPRSGNASSGASGFTPRVKPLYFCAEKEVLAYAWLNGIADTFVECPHVTQSYRHVIRDALNSYAKDAETKRKILRNYLAMKARMPADEGSPRRVCERCGEPSSKDICNACKYLAMLRE